MRGGRRGSSVDKYSKEGGEGVVYSRGGRINSIVGRDVWMSIAGREGCADEYSRPGGMCG